MAQYLKPRVYETTSTTGTGTVQLAGALGGSYRTFLSAFGNGGKCYYSIYASPTSYEYGFGTINASNQLSRDLVIDGSGGPMVLVNFAAGVKTVINGIPPEACLNNGNQTFVNNDTTPDVRTGNVWIAGNTSGTSITFFDGGIDGQQITIYFTNSNTTIVHGASLRLAGGSNFIGTANDILRLVRIAGLWFEAGRSVNT
jgi:hypothetical protein